MVQLIYPEGMDVAQPGQLVDSRPSLTISRAADGAIRPGKAVMDGTEVGKQVAVMTDKTKAFRGIARFTHILETPRDGSDAEYADTDAVNVLRKGYVWVKVNEAVSAGDTAYVDCANANPAKKGDFCKTSTNNVSTGYTFCSSATEGNLAALEIDLTGAPQAMEHTAAPTTTPAPTTPVPTTPVPTTGE